MPTKWDAEAMRYTGPSLADCQRAWDYLVGEYVTDLAIRLEFQAAKEPSFRARLILWSPGLDPETGAERAITWATKELQAGFEAVTYRQLYDLLMIGHRAIEAKLGGQGQLPLS